MFTIRLEDVRQKNRLVGGIAAADLKTATEDIL